MMKILAADIGGTNCRMGLFTIDNGLLMLDRTALVETGDIAHTEALLATFERELETQPNLVDAAVVAIAGPVEDAQRGKLSNGDMIIDFTPLNRERARFFLLNDFMAQAYAVLSPEGESARLIAGPEHAAHDGARGVIGAGTGLGQAMVKRIATPVFGKMAQWIAVGSESAHGMFPFTGKREFELAEFMAREMAIPYVTGDDLLSGRGLSKLHYFLTGENLRAEEVGPRALTRDTETRDWFARMYGRAARHWILTTLCEGGLWIAGGIAAKNPSIVTCDAFREELYNSQKWQGLLEAVPVYLMENTDSGLWGAARFGQQQIAAGI